MTEHTTSLNRRTLLGGAAAIGLTGVARAQAPANVKVGLIVPLSGLYARPGAVMKMGAELGIADVNAGGGIKALGGAKLELVTLDCGDTVERAKTGARGVAGKNTVSAPGGVPIPAPSAWGVGKSPGRGALPLLTLPYPALRPARGFRHIFQTAATAGSQSEQGLPQLMELA